MKIRDMMSPDVELVDPNSTIRDAALKMRAEDIGALPVGENDRLIGMVTDRDIVTRCTAEGHQPSLCRVRDAMSKNICYCFEDDDLDAAAHIMAEHQVRRLPVLNSKKRLVGMISLGDLSQCESGVVKSTLQGIAEDSGLTRRMTH
ncbi:MAG TPA: CBS domain-containing protein [Micropepsaceae bacterium]|nr:CBS domain-containing protein [Micropepsaceae bacterium]